MSNFILHFGSLIIYVLLQFSCAQQPSTYYIDAVSGKDSNSGNTPQEAWQSIARINRAIFRPGDKILFKTGCKWQETLTISHSGTSQNPIIYDAYGAEQKPVITAVDLLVGTDGNYWMSHNDSIWYLEKTADPKRLWLNGKEYPRSLDIKHINQHFRWFYEENRQRLYLFNWNKPENSTMKIEIATGRDMALVARNADYITIRNIALEGGSQFSLHINYCDYVVIENCEVGKYSGKYGFFASHSSQGILRDCQVDSWHRIKYTYDYAAVEDGIKLYNGCSGWEIYRNEVQDWGHSCIQIQSKDRQNPTSNNRIYSNKLNYNTSNSPLPNNDVRAIAIDGNSAKWIGTDGGGLAKFDATGWSIFDSLNSGIPHNDVRCVINGSNSEIWAGTDGGGLARMEGVNWALYTSNNSNLPDNWIRSFAYDHNSSLWIGTGGGGVANLNDTTWLVFDTSNSNLPANRVNAIVVDPYGNKWFGTEGGGIAIYQEGGVTGLENRELPAIPDRFISFQNYPNPFNPTTTIRFSLPTPGGVQIKIFNVIGEEIATLHSDKLSPGYHEIQWDAEDFPSGIYFYLITAGSFQEIHRMVLIK